MVVGAAVVVVAFGAVVVVALPAGGGVLAPGTVVTGWQAARPSITIPAAIASVGSVYLGTRVGLAVIDSAIQWINNLIS